MTELEIKATITEKLFRYFAVAPEDATEEQMYKAVVYTVNDALRRKGASLEKQAADADAKRVYYMCMEFLIGPSLKNNLLNLGIYQSYSSVLKDMGFSLERFTREEADPGLGNGGLGRLAACYMDALTSLDYPARGYCICYEYGLFRQKIVDGEQIELPDVWLPSGECWLLQRADKTFKVGFNGTVKEHWYKGGMSVELCDADEVEAVPYDLMISGSDCKAVSVLRLWKARDIQNFNMKLFSQGQYVKALSESTNAEIISKVLYPSDNHEEGKLLRLSQQYFLVSASLQNILNEHLEKYGTYDNFADKAAIHINDTHPALCVAELMRLLMDECACSWEKAWDITTKTLSYTNHTVMPEALECWNENLFKFKLPRIYSIICEINRRFCEDLWNRHPGDWDKIARMSIIEHGQVKMANLSVVGSHTVNGVSALHSDILKTTVFKDFYEDEPEKFTNVTNGIAHRRWLVYSNPKLSRLLDECIGTDYRKNPERLRDFLKFQNDSSVLSRLNEIKQENKQRLVLYAQLEQGVSLDSSMLFDVQVKRMHEYKRQLLNALRIIGIYNTLRNDPSADITPQTFIFSAKAAPGYYMAKRIIKLITSIGADIDKNTVMREKLRVVFLENYCVSLAEILIPAAEISEQISLAGKEASGTGNMKLMMNGALTIGTLDGANVEMRDALGGEAFYLFGLNTAEVEALWKSGYESSKYFNESPALRGIIETLNRGFNGESFSDISNYLLFAHGVADPYMCFADFSSYCAVHEKMNADYADREKWAKMSLCNVACSGGFAADRAIREYAERIWHIKPVL